MTSKSRLGKGLGALFPTLPGEQDANAQLELLPDTDKHDGAEAQAGAGATAVKDSVKSGNAGAVAGESGTTAKQSASKHQKKTAGKRASMPSIGAIAHPSDLFFGGEDVPTATTPIDTFMPIPGAAQHAVRADESKDVSRETSQPASAGKDKDAKDSTGSSEQSGEDKPVELKPVEGGYLAELKLSDIGPNAHQPRTIFDEDELNELSASIKEVGVLQPIVVRRRPADQIAAAKAEQQSSDTESNANPFAGRMDSPYELIMGERRWRASQLAGLETIPAIVKTTADDDMLRDALLENLHRVALNPLEEAAAYQQMIDEFGLTQAQLSKSVSKSRPQIANTLRLLNLPAAVQKKVAAGVLSSGHARALLGLTDPEEMDKLASRIIAEGLSVRSAEEIVSMKIASGEQPKKPKTSKTNPWVGSAIQQSLENHFDTKVSIKGTQKHGRIEIVFSSPEDMDRILQLLVPGQGDAAASGSGDSKWV
ncbi:ParB/RepB/Spo0J family partition protein [Bifidobacterium miconisargentati]|uniref:ParB/RepB/Spo0J family partition protein n=1 Tax=Bifidobacterium miconisargentati TaxID=2834437 RepID=UPI001BDC5C23|nr:ParB/RepB/Spo0J family partition protein [Bifidobacterium miconisargentati]MBW3090336.1 ParB/RepB/Spo0J family partition protein [Bifidobacterium miconisargentati]